MRDYNANLRVVCHRLVNELLQDIFGERRIDAHALDSVRVLLREVVKPLLTTTCDNDRRLVRQ